MGGRVSGGGAVLIYDKLFGCYTETKWMQVRWVQLRKQDTLIMLLSGGFGFRPVAQS